jgi:hypothetical protein
MHLYPSSSFHATDGDNHQVRNSDMAQLSSLKSLISDKEQSSERIGELAGFGSIFGIIAAVLGLLIGKSLIPIAGIEWQQTSISPFVWIIEGNPNYHFAVGAFMGILALSLLFQALGSKGLGAFIGSGFVNIFWVGFVVAIATALFIPTQFAGIIGSSLIPNFVSTMYFLGALFVIIWQIGTIVYTDSSKTWVGAIAGLLNALFIPVLALGQAISPLLIYVAYGILLVGQLMSLKFWWSPYNTIREYARSSSKAKMMFGISGLLTFVFGLTAIFLGPVGSVSGVGIWSPWSILTNDTTYQTNPALIFGLLSLMLFWIMLAPRLGSRELKAAAIGEDIIKGGNKYFMMLLAIIGLIATAQASAHIDGVAAWGFFCSIAPAGIMFIMGASYTAKTDIVTGIPLVVASVFLIVHPFNLLLLVVVPWLLIILTQFLLVIETSIRGLTGFSQGALTVVVSLAASISIVIFMLGGFGSGPLALWPTNRWFNITMIPGISAAIQGPAIIVLPLLALLIRNVALAGYSYGRGYSTGGVLLGVSFFFVILIPAIAGNESVAHEANTGAALLLALYAISVMLVMSMNINLANDVQEEGHNFEGSLIKIATIAGLIAAAIVMILVFLIFAGIPSPVQIALIVSIMVTFVVSSEILSILGWLLAGIRLNMLRKGFKFTKLEK